MAEPIKRDISLREKQVLLGVFQGQSNRKIGADMGISVKTVEKHRQALNRAFAANNPVSMVVSALRAGVIML